MIQRAAVLAGFGFLVGLLAALNWSQVPAVAQAPAKAETPHFQITSWAYPGFARQGGTESPRYGAYVLDTRTGEVWIVKEDNEPRSVGKVSKP